MNLINYEKYYHSGSEFIIPRDEFEKIIEENQRLNNDIKILLKENEAKEKVIIKQNNVLNETTEYLKYQLSNLDFEKDIKARMLCSMVIVMLEWKELKESD